MSNERVPAWLADFQAQFGDALRTPLDASSGTLRAVPERYAAAVSREVSAAGAWTAAERLAVYNRQYWFRLFGVLQNAYPLTARLLGYFRFNGHAAEFLSLHPPRGWNIDHAGDGFDGFLKGTLTSEPLLEAVAIDTAYRRVFLAPPSESYRPSAVDAERLLQGRLRPSAIAAIVEEHWPLVDLRRRLGSIPGERAVALPARLPSPRFWAFVRRPGGMAQLGLEPREAQLFRLLAEHPVATALGLLEASCTSEEREHLPANAQRWLARSVELDFWSGLVSGGLSHES